MTTLKKINNLTWYSNIIKLKEVLKELLLTTATSQNFQVFQSASPNRLTLAQLNTTYPNAQIGFTVHNFYSGGGIAIFFKTTNGWLTQSFNQVT